MILRGVFFCILKSTSHSTNVYVMDNCLTVLLQDFAIHLMPKRSWLAGQIACHPFCTPLSAQHRYQSLVDRHQTVPQDTWILPVAQPPADTDPEQVFHPYFVLFIHAGSSWSLPEKKKKKWPWKIARERTERDANARDFSIDTVVPGTAWIFQAILICLCSVPGLFLPWLMF